jgi:adenylate cyclase
MLAERARATLTRHRGSVGAAAVVVALAALGLFEPYEHGLLERFFEVRGVRPPTAPIVIVSIDEASFVELNEQWPFTRATHARLLDAVAAGRPLAIGFDVIFDQPSAWGPGDDEALGHAVARAGNVVLGAAPAIDRQGFTTRYVPNLPLPEIRRGAAAVAAVNLRHDPDSKVRRAPQHVWTGAESLPTLGAALHRLATAAGVPAAPLPAAEEVLVNFRGPPRTFPWISYYRVVRGEVPPEVFAGAVVLIGPTSEPMHDTFATPFTSGGDLMPGVEIHANVLQTFIAGDHVRAVPAALSATLAALAALAAGALVVQLPPLPALAAVAGLALLVTAGAGLVFAAADVWVRALAALLALALGYAAAGLDRFVREHRERRRLAQFFSPAVLREVVRHRHERSLGSSRRLLTVLFADIRGFTALSERLQPEEVAAMLREYLTEMTEVVFEHGGTVDKYIGDCVMALYNVPLEDPDHVRSALHTALALQERTLEVSARWEGRLGAAIRTGIGINTGEAVVGTMGSRQRLEYTAVGDTINLASRLEALTKEHGVAIVISEFTRQRLGDEFLTRELGEMTVRGRTQPEKVYGVLPADIRKHPRAVLDVATTVVLVGDGEAVPVTARNVGQGGVALTDVPATWAAGTRVQMRCEGGLLPRPLVAEGVVAWRRGDEAGVTFAGLDPDASVAVAEYLARTRG